MMTMFNKKERGDVKKMINDTKQRFTLRMPKKLNEELKYEARKQGISVNALILQVLWTWIEDSDLEVNSSGGIRSL